MKKQTTTLLYVGGGASALGLAWWWFNRNKTPHQQQIPAAAATQQQPLPSGPCKYWSDHPRYVGIVHLGFDAAPASPQQAVDAADSRLLVPGPGEFYQYEKDVINAAQPLAIAIRDEYLADKDVARVTFSLAKVANGEDWTTCGWKDKRELWKVVRTR